MQRSQKLKTPNSKLSFKEKKTVSFNSVKKTISSSILFDIPFYRDHVLNNIMNAIIIIDTQGNFVYYNKSFLRVTGYSEEEAKNLHFSQILPESKLEEQNALFQKAMQEVYEINQFETEIKTKQGKIIPIMFSATSIMKNGKIIGVVASGEDLTKLKKIERDLLKTNEQLQKILEVATDGITVVDSQANIIYTSESSVDILGFKNPNDLKSKDSFDVIKDFELYDENENKISILDLPSTLALKGKISKPLTIKVVPKNKKEERWVIAKASPIFDEKGNVSMTVNSFSEITEQKKAENELKKSEGELKKSKIQLEKILEATSEGITVTNSSGEFVYANKMGLKIMGLDEHINIHEITPQDVIENFIIFDEKNNKLNLADLPYRMALQGEESPAILLHVVNKKRELDKWVHLKSSPIFDENKNVTSTVNVFYDFTDQRKNQLALENSEKEFRQLAESLPQMIWVSDSFGKDYFYNQTFYDYTGLKYTQFENTNDIWKAIIHPNDFSNSSKKWKISIETGDIYEIEYRLKKYDGTYRWHLTRAVPIKNSEGEIIKWIGSCTDIENQKSNEEYQKFLKNFIQAVSSSIDYEQTLENIVKICVPDFADWCQVDLLEDDGALQAALFHKSSKSLKILQSLGKYYKNKLPKGSKISRAINKHATLHVNNIDDVYYKKMNLSKGHENILKKIDLTSYLVSPLQVRNKIIGTIIFGLCGEERKYSESDIFIAEELAHHASIAIDNAQLYKSAQEEIQERRKVEMALRESEHRFRILADTAPVMIWMADQNKGCYYLNKTWLNFRGRTMDQERESGWTEGIHPDDLQYVNETFDKAFDQRKDFLIEYRIKRYDGEYRWVMDSGIPRFSAEGEYLGYIGSCMDITERNIAENKLKESLKEKELLLKEIHHRVKNNLQIISSLLSMQSLYIQDPKALEIFKECQNRVKSMAGIHEKLYKSADMAKVDFANYVRDMVANLFQTYGIEQGKIEIEIDVPSDVFLTIEKAIPCGLIINELISNSFKYAFPNGTRGKIFARMHAKNGNILLEIGDNGIGFPKDLDFRKTDTLGMQLITLLTDQLGGSIKLIRKNGTIFKIEFKS